MMHHAKMIDDLNIPETEVAVRRFESFSGRLTVFSQFGEDPLRQHPDLVAQREADFMNPNLIYFFIL